MFDPDLRVSWTGTESTTLPPPAYESTMRNDASELGQTAVGMVYANGVAAIHTDGHGAVAGVACIIEVSHRSFKDADLPHTVRIVDRDPLRLTGTLDVLEGDGPALAYGHPSVLELSVKIGFDVPM